MRWGERGGRRRPLLVGLLAVLITAPSLFAIHQTARSRVGTARAARIALAAPQVHAALGAGRGLRSRAESFDGSLTRIDFFRGGRIVASAALTAAGRVTQFEDYSQRRVPYGNWIAYEPGVVAGLSVLFILMVAVRPLRRMRNLDVLACLVITASVVLFARRFLELSLLIAAGGLGYLLVRCAWFGLRGVGPDADGRPLLAGIMAGLAPPARQRILRLGLAALALVYVMIAVSSPQAVDVIYAVMEGATKLLHGVLPYGHLPGDVVHGDTYPLLSYLAYAPLAAAAPVRSVWDSVDLALGATALAALGASGLLLRVRFAERPAGEDEGLRSALAWLCFPPILIAVSTGTTDLTLAAPLLAAVAAWRRPALAAGLLTAAGWFKLAPFALLPLCLAGRSRSELRHALSAIAAVSAPLLGLVLLLGSGSGLSAMVHAVAFQFTRGTPQSVWAMLGITAWQPLAQALAIGLIVAAAVRLHERPATRAEIAALCAAILLALQLAANYWSFLYVVWFVPLLTVSLLAAAQAPVAQPARRRHQPLGAPLPVGV